MPDWLGWLITTVGVALGFGAGPWQRWYIRRVNARFIRDIQNRQRPQ